MSDLHNYFDARLLTEFNPDDPQYAAKVVITIGRNVKWEHWETAGDDLPHVRALFDVLAHHPEEKTKDGSAFVCGAMLPGNRLKTAVTAMYALGYDFDGGTDPNAIDAGYLKIGCAFLRYTSFSNGKTRSDFSRDTVAKFLKCTKSEIDTAAMRRYVREKERWVEEVAATVELIEVKQVSGGFKCFTTHAPQHKNRVIVPLAQPFVIDDYENLQEATAKWNEIYFGVAESIGLLEHIDKTGADLNRLFYFPRHPKHGQHETVLAGGDLLDWHATANPYLDAVDAIEARDKKSKGKSKTAEGKALGRWSMKAAHGFQIVDAIEAHCPDIVRGKGSSGVDIVCPFDEDHSNAGDSDDRACFAVNAGEGSTDFFTISCRHDSCRDYTMLDMLGKLIKDSLLPKNITENEEFNALASEDAPQPEAAERIEREDNARAEYLKAISDLEPEHAYDPAKIEGVVKLILDAGLDGIAENAACKALGKRLGVKQSAIDATFNKHKLTRAKVDSAKKSPCDSNGRLLFRYAGEFSFPNATDICTKRLLEENTKAKLPHFTQMSGVLMRLTVEIGEQSGHKKVSFTPMSARATWAQLSKRISFIKTYGAGEGEPEDVPERVANYVWEMAREDFPVSPEILSAPFYKSDGALVLSESYHFNRAEGLNHYLVLNGLDVGDVPVEPTREQMEEARDWLRLELFSDFPFLDTDTDKKGQIRKRREPSEAHAFALLLTPFMRRMIAGHTPLFMVSKPQPNVGATFLAHCAMQITDGEANTKGLTYTKNEEELQKSLVSAILTPRTFMFFDNVRDFDNQILIRNLTSHEVGGRVLGGSREAFRPNNFVWLATGIRPRMSAEMQRRTCRIELNPELASTDNREFKHKDLATFIVENRELIIRHLLTMVEYWQSQGRPEFTEREKSSYENWSRIVGGVLECCGITGFLDNAESAPPDMTQTRENDFLAAFLAKYSTGEQEPKAIFDWAEDSGYRISDGRMEDDRREGFLPALLMLTGRTVEVQKRRFGFHYRQDKKRGFVFGMHDIVETNSEAKQ